MRHIIKPLRFRVLGRKMKDKLLTVAGVALFVGVILGGVIMGLSTSAVYQTIIDRERAAHALDLASRDAEIAALEERIVALRESFSFEGVASYYGTHEDGNQTANQEIFSRHAMTAALVWPLPINCWYSVTRTDTGASVRIWANDRLPSEHRRIVDLSEAAAKKINMIRQGTVTVRLRPEEK